MFIVLRKIVGQSPRNLDREYHDEMKQMAEGYMPKFPGFVAEDCSELIGDVGVVYKGRFMPLFNITLDADDERNRRQGVPEGFEPIPFRQETDVQVILPPSVFMEPWVPLCCTELKETMSVGSRSDK